jgi:hypothetical protein
MACDAPRWRLCGQLVPALLAASVSASLGRPKGIVGVDAMEHAGVAHAGIRTGDDAVLGPGRDTSELNRTSRRCGRYVAS